MVFESLLVVRSFGVLWESTRRSDLTKSKAL